MTKTKIRIEKVTLEEIKKIIPPELLERSGNQNNNHNVKKKKQQPAGKTKARS
jgi:hypothetical protein